LNASPANTVNVQATSSSLDIYSAVAYPAVTTDTVNVGAGDPANNLPGGDLDTVTGQVTVHGNPSVTSVNLLDQNAWFAGIYDIANQDVTRSFQVSNDHPFGGSTPFAGLHYSGLSHLALDTEAADNTVNVASTAVGTATTINTGSGAEGVDIGEGNLIPIEGPVTVNGNNTDTEVS